MSWLESYPTPTCWRVFLSPKIAFYPRHYWWKSIWSGGLAESSPQSSFHHRDTETQRRARPFAPEDQRGFFGSLWGDSHPHLLAPVFECQNRVCPASLLAQIELERGTCGSRSSVLSPQTRKQ